MTDFRKILAANRGEMGKQTVAVYAKKDKLSLHRFKADEAWQIGQIGQIGQSLSPVGAYLSIPEIIRVARESGADAIHPGYGLLSENPELVEACDAAGRHLRPSSTSREG